MKPHPGEVATGSPVAQRDVNSTKEAGSPQQGAAPAQEWRSPGGGQALPDMLERAASLLLSGLDTLRDDLLAAAEYLRAPTPEFIAGWLAGREKSAGLVKAEFGDRLARRIRALAPPSAPPVQPASGGNRRAAKNDAPSELASSVAPAVPDTGRSNEDRMLLLKALANGYANIDWWPDRLLIDVDSDPVAVSLDAEGFPILTPELRAAMLKAEANHG